MAGTNITLAGDLGTPASILIEKISDAIGGIAKPWQIQRVANAEAQADLIRAEAQIKIGDIEHRALQRMINEEAKKQRNIENIADAAACKLTDQSHPEELDDDWISFFFEKCKSISDEKIQEIWARLLAKESDDIGSFSKQTIDILSKMGNSDIRLIEKIYNFNIGNLFIYINSSEDEICKAHGINFSNLCDLESLGIIQFNLISGYILKVKNLDLSFNHFGKNIKCSNAYENWNLSIGCVMLTRSGREIERLVSTTPNDDIFNYVVENIKKTGINVEIS